MIVVEVICLIGLVMMACGLVYEKRRSPYTWIIVVLAVGFIGTSVWHAATDWLRNYTVAA